MTTLAIIISLISLAISIHTLYASLSGDWRLFDAIAKKIQAARKLVRHQLR